MKLTEQLFVLTIIFLYFLKSVHTQNSTNTGQQENNATIILENEVTIMCMRNTNEPPQKVTIDDPNIGNVINLNREVFFITHGWTESTLYPWMNDTQKDLITYYGRKSTVCTVDWRRLAAFEILAAEVHARLVGAYLAKFINFLNSKGVKYSQVNLIGHSLGAKVSSECGQVLKGKLGSIYALDPAAIGLDVKDAQYTQCAFCAFGEFRPMVGNCYVNFYFNGGVEQPACKQAKDFFCSHVKCQDYFRYSLNPANKMYGYICRFSIWGLCLYRDKDLFGLYTFKKDGKLNTRTKDTPPYALGDIGDI